MKNSKRILRFALHDATNYAKRYSLDEKGTSLLVIEAVEKLNLSGKTFSSAFVIIVLCQQGYVDFMKNGVKQRLEKNGLLVNFGATKISDVEMSPDFKAKALVESHDFVQETLMTMMNMWPYLVYLIDHPIIMLGERELSRIESNYRLIIERLQNKDHLFKREATIANLQACYFDVCDLIGTRAPKPADVAARSYGVFDQFMQLIAREYCTHREVKWYADQLKMSPKYLSEIVKEVSGRPAGQWITSFVITDIKALLRNSDLSIKEIAVEMNFPNQSFLGKYFKNATGMSPVEYRNGL